MQLSIPDIFKNYLLFTLNADKHLDDSVFDDFDEEWEDILGELGRRSFTDFLRCHIGMRDELPPKNRLYGRLRNEVSDTAEVMPYIKELNRSAPVYTALQDYKDNFWIEYDERRYAGARDYLEVLGLLNVKTPLSLLMAVYRQFSAAEFITVLKLIAVISIRRDAAGGQRDLEPEKIYSTAAGAVMRGEITPAETAGYLRPLYPGDDDFRRGFSRKAVPFRPGGKKQIMFLLRKLEQHLSESGEAPAVNLSVEHVLPRHPGDEWREDFGRDNCRSAVDRLGNMAILPVNRNMGQESFEEKRRVLQESGYRINRHIAQYTEWNMESLDDHQQWLADQAVRVWRSEQLG